MIWSWNVLPIRESPIAKKEFGNITDVQIAIFGYELEFAGATGAADFECDVTGTSATGKAYIKLKKDSNGWKVMDGKAVIDKRNVLLL